MGLRAALLASMVLLSIAADASSKLDDSPLLTDGRDDGLVWRTPDGMRQTPMLAGRVADTAPFGWTRDAKTFHEYVTGTVSRLKGRGFSKDELDDLQTYITSIKPPPRATADEVIVKEGAVVFASAGCASCHTGTTTTDGAKHEVDAAGARFPVGNFATPSLRFVGGTARCARSARATTRQWGRQGTYRAPRSMRSRPI